MGKIFREMGILFGETVLRELFSPSAWVVWCEGIFPLPLESFPVLDNWCLCGGYISYSLGATLKPFLLGGISELRGSTPHSLNTGVFRCGRKWCTFLGVASRSRGPTLLGLPIVPALSSAPILLYHPKVLRSCTLRSCVRIAPYITHRYPMGS
jgi:hypothetical protein